MKVAVVASSDDSGLGASFVRSARALGHNSVLVAADELVSGSRRIMLARRLHAEELVAAPRLRELRKTLIEVQPTVIVVVKGRFIPLWWLQDLRRSLGKPIVNYYPDHPEWPGHSDRQILEALRAYDEVVIWGEHPAESLVKRGLQRVRVIPFGYDPLLYREAPEPVEHRWDISLIGQFYRERLQFVQALGDREIFVSGRGWTRGAAGTAVSGRVSDRTYSGRDISRFYWESTAAFNIVAPWNAMAHNMRTFEIPATGTVMVASWTPDHELLYGDEGAVLVKHPREAREALLALAQDDERCHAIAAEGRRRVEGHTYTQRMASLLEPWTR